LHRERERERENREKKGRKKERSASSRKKREMGKLGVENNWRLKKFTNRKVTILEIMSSRSFLLKKSECGVSVDTG